LTIGTLDGANIEIRESVGDENVFIFGLTAAEVGERQRAGSTGWDAVHGSALLKQAVSNLSDGLYSPDDKDRYRPIVEDILGHDEFMVAADFDSYWQMQRKVDDAWRDRTGWWRTSLRNTASMGWFSSDRTVREYAEEIWRVPTGPSSIRN
jgi:starch phosphorylase